MWGRKRNGVSVIAPQCDVCGLSWVLTGSFQGNWSLLGHFLFWLCDETPPRPTHHTHARTHTHTHVLLLSHLADAFIISDIQEVQIPALMSRCVLGDVPERGCRSPAAWRE